MLRLGPKAFAKVPFPLMKRYEGKGLPQNPTVAVIANDAIGNFIVATPLLQMIRRELSPSSVHYFGGTRTLEFQDNSDLFEKHFPLHGKGLREAYEWVDGFHYDLVVNVEQGSLAKAFAGLICDENTYVCGPAIGTRGDIPFSEDIRGDLWRDMEWISEKIREKYPFLQSSFIGEIYTRLAYLEGEVPKYKIPRQEPTRAIPDCLVAPSASLPEKLWPLEKWVEVLTWLKEQGKTAGVLGAKPAVQKEHWKGSSVEEELVQRGLVEDLRGEFTLPEVVGALGKAKFVLTLDNGILHAACASGTKTVGLFRHGIHRLWAPPYENLTVLTPGEEKAVESISLEMVKESLQRVF